MLSTNLGQVSILTSPANRYTCVNCSVGFQSTAEQRCHFKTEWHLYNLKRKVCKLEPIDLESFQKIQELAPSDTPSKTRSKADSDLDLAQPVSLEQNYEVDSEDEANWEVVDDEELLDEDYDEEEAEEMLARVVKSNTCLFCDKTTQKIRDNLDHMNSRHGFFIPEEKYLIDLDGFMEYLGFKVGAGLTCLWCNKQFSSLHGVRLHMLYKDHCKILYDHEKAIDEFKDFYDYTDQIQIAMKPLNQLVVSKKKRSRSEHRPIVPHHSSSKNFGQMVVRTTHRATLVSQTYHSRRSIKKFNSDRAKRLLHVGMQNNNAMRGRLRQQNPM